MPRKKKEIKPEKIGNDIVADQTVKRKLRVAKRNVKNTFDPDNTSTSSDTSKPGRGKPGSNIKRKDRNGGKIVSSIEQNNNLEERVSEYFSSSSRCNPSLKGKKVKQEGRKTSYASKARNLKNCSIILSDVGSDDEFEASTINYKSPDNKRSTSSKNKSSQGKTSKTNTVKVMNADIENDSIKSSIEEKYKDIEAKDPSANSEKVNKGNYVKSGRKRKDTIENDLEIKKPKLKATKPKKCIKGKEVKTDKRGIKEKTARKVKIESTKNIDTDQDNIDNLKHVEGAAKQKENVTDTQNEASGSSDDEMMDVEEDDNLMTVSKTSLPTSVDHSDAMAVLMHMEGPKQNYLTEKPSTSKASDVDDNEHLSEDDDEEESDWEDVADHHGNSPKKSQLPSGPVEITLDAPVIYRKKKKKVEFDLQAYFRRQINKFKREVAMDIHKVHLLFLLARCQYLNNLCMEETVQAQVFSITLVTKELKLPPTKSCTESHVTQVLYCIQEKQHYLSDIMAESFSKVSTQLKITLICVVLLRQVGFLTRFVTSLQPVPFKESGSKSSSSKKGKSPKSSKGKEKGTTESIRSTSKPANSKSGKKNISIKSEQSVKTEQIKTEKMEIDEDVSNNRKGPKGGKLVKRRSSDRKCSKVSKNAYKEDASFDDEKLSDDNDDDYVPNDDNTDDDQENKHKRKRSKIKKETKISSDENDSIKEENLSDDDFEEDSILIRTQQLKKETSKSKNRKALSSDSDPDNIGVDNWAEVYIEREKKWLCVDCVKLQVLKPYEIENKATQPVSYVVGITQEGYIRDVTARYASQWLTETRKHRVDNEWWDETLQPYKCPDKARDQQEDHELSSQLQQRLLPTSIGAFKSHPLYVLKRHLLKFEALYPDTAIPVGYIRGEPVYARECVHTLHSRENWLKEGRAVRVGEEPYKFVKSRPKWNRPKEDPEAKDLELFGLWQTELYIPPPAVDGKVPRNAHGNVEMFLPSMLPAGTVHLKVPALNKVAKKLDIDCAPAMVGWDHHCGFSHPLMDGWIVCEEYKDILLAAWDEEQEIIREKEQQNREKRVYDNWRKLIRGMLIKERLKKRFDLEEKPVEDGNKSDDIVKPDNKQPAGTTNKVIEKATDKKHAWPQNRMVNNQQHVCAVEEL